MAKDDKVKKLRKRSRFAAMEGLRPQGGPPVPPRKAMARAKKMSKKLPYPVSPYPGAGPLQVYRWAQHEWGKVGRWQTLVAPVAILVGLLTWEKEKALQEARWEELERADLKEVAAVTYGAYGPAKKRRKLFGFIPLPGKK